MVITIILLGFMQAHYLISERLLTRDNIGAFALAIKDELDIDANETMLYAENREVANGNSRLLDYVNSNTQRVGHRSKKGKKAPFMNAFIVLLKAFSISGQCSG